MRVRRTGGWWAILAAFAASGCYTFVPVENPEVGTEVRVKVPVRSSVGSSSGDTEMVSFEGRLVSLGDTLLLGTRSTQVLGAHRERVTLDTVRVAATEYRDLEERVLSKGRTAALTVAVVGGAIGLAAALTGWAGGSEGDRPGDTPNPQPSLVPKGFRLFGVRIPIPWPSG